MIRTYIFNRKELENVTYFPEILSPERRSKIEKLKREEDRQLSASAELILIYALRQFTETALPLNIERDDRNKPFLTDLPYYFNFSHAGDYAACALSDGPIGIDIEYFRVKEIASADRMLYPEEAATLAYISNPVEKKKFFYECWVAKESYLKNLGIGLIVRPRDFMVSENTLKIMGRDFSDLKGHHSVSFTAVEESREKKGDTTLQDNLSFLEKRYVHVFEPGEVRGTDWKFDAGYRMAICSQEKDPDLLARLINARDINSCLLK